MSRRFFVIHKTTQDLKNAVVEHLEATEQQANGYIVEKYDGVCTTGYRTAYGKNNRETVSLRNPSLMNCYVLTMLDVKDLADASDPNALIYRVERYGYNYFYVKCTPKTIINTYVNNPTLAMPGFGDIIFRIDEAKIHYL